MEACLKARASQSSGNNVILVPFAGMRKANGVRWLAERERRGVLLDSVPVPYKLPNEGASAKAFPAEEESADSVLLEGGEFARAPTYPVIARDEEPTVRAEPRQDHFVGRALREVVPEMHHVFAKRFHAAGQRLAQVLVDQEGHAAILRSKATAASTSSRRRPHQSQAA